MIKKKISILLILSFAVMMLLASAYSVLAANTGGVAKGNRVMFSVGKSSNSAPAASGTSRSGKDNKDYGYLSNIRGEGHMYEIFKDNKVPDGVSLREWMLTHDMAFNTRSIAFASDAAPGYSFVTKQGYSDYERYDLDAEIDAYKEELRALYTEELEEHEDEILEQALKKAYPVGSVYVTMNNESAADVEIKFGGEWEELLTGTGTTKAIMWATGAQTSFSYYQSNNYTATKSLTLGSIGGEEAVTLGTYTMPSHSHGLSSHRHTLDAKNNWNKNGSSKSRPVSYHATLASGESHYGSSSSAPAIGASGSGQAHNNMPPYITVRAFKKVGE